MKVYTPVAERKNSALCNAFRKDGTPLGKSEMPSGGMGAGTPEKERVMCRESP